MDRVFKKITEGLEIFDGIYERHQSATNASQKDKLENDLKKEIKKLQRFREQVKNWQAGTEIKDKAQLVDHRKLVEVAMEKYKDVEKGSKLKAYSDISLAAVDKPMVVNEATEFIAQAIDSLQQQTESMESEMDKLTGAGKKSKKKDFVSEERKRELVELLSTHQWHIEKLEAISKLLQTEVLSVDTVMDLSDDIQYYIDENENPDFIYDDSIYDELDLDVEDEEEVEINDINEENATSANTTGLASTPPSSSEVPPPTAVTVKPSLVKKVSELQEKRSNSRSASILSEKPQQVVHQISVAANNATTITALKPAPAPIPTTAMNWSAAIARPKDKDPSPVSLPVKTTNANAINAACVLEALKKQKPKEETPGTTSPPHQSVPKAQRVIQQPTLQQTVQPTLQPTLQPILQQTPSQQPPQARVSSPLRISKLGQSPRQIEEASKPNFRFLPSGLQNFILSLARLEDDPSADYDQFESVNFTPGYSFPPDVQVMQLNQLWQKVALSQDIGPIIATRECSELFYGYYYGMSTQERTLCAETLQKQGWLRQNSHWVLPKADNAYGVFDTVKWAIVDAPQGLKA